jgi:hypothetical protein
VRNTWIFRHWRGELSLPNSYWINSVLLAGVVYGILVTAGLVLLFLPIYGWSIVGTWRAAQTYMAQHRGTRRPVWGGLACFMVATGLLSSIVNVIKALAS